MAANKYRVILLFLTLLITIGAAQGFCGTINTKVTSHTTILSDGKINIQYEIGNTGDDTAYHMTVTTFLGLDAQKSDDLGNNPPGGSMRYNCALQPSALKPGKYTLVARISFSEQNGAAHKVYHFSPIPYHMEKSMEVKGGLNVSLTDPYFRAKSLWQSGNTCKLSLENNLDLAIQPVVSLYLPDGFVTKEPERSYQLAPGEKKEVLVPFEMEYPVKVSKPFYALVWYEHNGSHVSHLIEGAIRVEEKPFYFKAFLIMMGVALVIVAVVFFLRRKNPTNKE